MGTKERIKRIEKQARADRRGIVPVRKSGKGYVNMDGSPLSSADLADLEEGGATIAVFDEITSRL